MNTLDELKSLEQVLGKSPVPQANQEWGGADVVVCAKAPQEQSGGGFYPESRYVVTPYSLELSWLFEQLRDAFYVGGKLDGCSKVEFFGRLANAANRCSHRSSSLTAHLLCAAVLHEAFAIYEEFDEGSFRSFAVAAGNEIVDDYVDDALRTGYIGTDATLAFFRKHGVEVQK